MSYKLEIAKARRLAVLLNLFFAPGYVLPRQLLCDQVNKTGFVTGMDLLNTEIEWLAEQGFVEKLELDAVRLTMRGGDIALGRSESQGVRRPDPVQP